MTSGIGMVEVTAELVLVPGGPPEVQRVSGTPDVVAAWLRAMAERLAPTRPVKRGGAPMLDETWQGRGDVTPGFNILPPPRP